MDRINHPRWTWPMFTKLWILFGLFLIFNVEALLPDTIDISGHPVHVQYPSVPPLADILNSVTLLQRKPTCYRNAAAAIIQHCKGLETDIPDGDRAIFAIKLSICELDLTQQTPDICRVEDRWRECVKTLATRDTWWTTFSGNLHEVGNVCWIGKQEVEKGDRHIQDKAYQDQLLELHFNLTVVQERLLEVLNSQFHEAEITFEQQREMQRVWEEFTRSLDITLEIISTNTTDLMKDLYTGLLSLQSLMRTSTRFVGDELNVLSKAAQAIHEELHQVREDIDSAGLAGKSKIQELLATAETELSEVSSL
jgi:hypothetical protein